MSKYYMLYKTFGMLSQFTREAAEQVRKGAGRVVSVEGNATLARWLESRAVEEEENND